MELIAFSGGSFKNENDCKIDVRGEEKEGKGEAGCWGCRCGWRRQQGGGVSNNGPTEPTSSLGMQDVCVSTNQKLR